MNSTPRDAGAAVDSEDARGPGTQLREARQSANLSLEEVASELHLNVATVRSIEQDSFDGLPAPAFVRGYITSYARLLKLPAGPILEAYDHQGFGPPRIVADITQEPQAKSTDIPVRLVTYLITAGLLVMVVMWWQTRESDNMLPPDGDQISAAPEETEPLENPEPTVSSEPAEPIQPEQPLADSIASADPQLPEAPTPEPSSYASAEPPLEPEGTTTGSEVTEPAPAIQELIDTLVTGQGPTESPEPPVGEEAGDAPQVAEAEAPETPPVPLEARPGENLLELNFGQESWLELYDGSGDRLAFRLASPGERLVVSARLPVKLVLGVAEGTRISLDGSDLDLTPFTKRGMARVLISTQGELAAAPREEPDAAEPSLAPAASDAPATATAEADSRPQD